MICGTLVHGCWSQVANELLGSMYITLTSVTFIIIHQKSFPFKNLSSTEFDDHKGRHTILAGLFLCIVMTTLGCTLGCTNYLTVNVGFARLLYPRPTTYLHIYLYNLYQVVDNGHIPLQILDSSSKS